MWKLISNELRIILDPFFLGDRNKVSEQVLLISTFQHYFKLLDPSLCKVTFMFPKYLADQEGLHTSFWERREVESIEGPPNNIIDFLEYLPKEIKEHGAFTELINSRNQLISLGIEKKCAFVLTDFKLTSEKTADLLKNYNIELLNLNEVQSKIEQFIQGFYNYFKFNLGAYGIDSPDIAHAMSDQFFNQILNPWQNKVASQNPSAETRESIRSFVHNRYVDILITIDQINFFKLQQRLNDIHVGITNNKEPRYHGSIRYYLNYHFFLIRGSVDHLAWILNDIFSLGYTPGVKPDIYNVGFGKKKKEFIEKIELVDKDLSDFIKSDPFQEWLYFLSEVRNKSAHGDLFSAPPLLVSTPESEISDEEIDKIIEKDKELLPEGVVKLLPPEFKENQKRLDRLHYKISKMEKGLEHFAVIKKDGQDFMFNPVGRLDIDLKNIKELVIKISLAYDNFLSKKTK